MDVAQLRQIEGMTLDLYKTVAPFLTVYSRDGDINPLSAPVEVLSSAPDLKGVVDFRKKREAFLSGNLDEAQPLDPKNPDTDDLNGFGPAYIVLVETAAPGEKYSAGKTFVIATGVDTDAPFRVLSVRPVPPNELEQARRETSND
jgi:general secretion pathway protein K